MDAITPKNRRTIARFPRDAAIRLSFEGGEIEATVRDISVTGMGVLTLRQFEPGTWLVVEPADPARCFSPELKAEVQHTTRSDKEGYLVGCRFSRLLTIEDVMAFG